MDKINGFFLFTFFKNQNQIHKHRQTKLCMKQNMLHRIHKYKSRSRVRV